MDTRGGRLPPYIKPLTSQSKITSAIGFLHSSEMTVLLLAACILLGGLMAIGAMTHDPSYHAETLW